MVAQWTGPQPLPEFDGGLIEPLVKALKDARPEAAGAEDGARNHPATDADAISETEKTILEIYERGTAQLRSWFDEQVVRLAQQQSAALVENAAGAKGELQSAKTEIDGLFFARHAQLWAVAMDAARRSNGLRYFRTRHQLDREPRPATVGRATAGALGLIVLVLVEAWVFLAIGARAFMPALTPGDAVLALTLSLSAVTSGFVAGFVGLRLIINSFVARRVLGAVALIASLGAAFALSTWVVGAVHFEVQPADIDAAFVAWGSTPTLYIVLGLGFVVAAFIGFSAFTDAYWDYGRHAVRHGRAQAKLGQAKDALRVEFDRIEQGLRERLNKRVKDARDLDAQSDAITVHGARLKQDIEQASYTLAEHCHRAISAYRESNRQARTSAPPSYFTNADVLSFARPELQMAMVRDLAQLVERETDDIGVLCDEILHQIALYAEHTLEEAFRISPSSQMMFAAARRDDDEDVLYSMGREGVSGGEIQRAAIPGAKSPWLEQKLRTMRLASGEAPLEGTGFAPKAFQRGHSALIFIAVHEHEQLNEVRKRIRAQDKAVERSGLPTRLGEAQLGDQISIKLQVVGGFANESQATQTWRGESLVFPFILDPNNNATVGTLSCVATIYFGEAMVGSIAFTRPIKGQAIMSAMAQKSPEPVAAAVIERDEIEMERVRSVFISYSHVDHERAAIVAGAYQRAGVAIFQDRMSIKSGEQWEPRLLTEIERRDLFHLCWSTSANSSDWVLKEARHALTTQKSSEQKRPLITIQMFEGPPWPPHPDDLDELHFDDFIRAASTAYGAARSSDPPAAN